MISNATKRVVLRWIHLVATIPVLGYIYSPPAQVEQYVGGARYIFAPLMFLTGYWMYAGAIFGIIGVTLWLVTFKLAGFGAALVSQVVLFGAMKMWQAIGARRSKK